MITYPELIERLKAITIKEKGYIKTHRKGNTGIGKTLEDLLGITENNIPGPNTAMIELKSARKNVSSMLIHYSQNLLFPQKQTLFCWRDLAMNLHVAIKEKNYIQQ